MLRKIILFLLLLSSLNTASAKILAQQPVWNYAEPPFVWSNCRPGEGCVQTFSSHDTSYIKFGQIIKIDSSWDHLNNLSFFGYADYDTPASVTINLYWSNSDTPNYDTMESFTVGVFDVRLTPGVTYRFNLDFYPYGVSFHNPDGSLKASYFYLEIYEDFPMSDIAPINIRYVKALNTDYYYLGSMWQTDLMGPPQNIDDILGLYHDLNFILEGEDGYIPPTPTPTPTGTTPPPPIPTPTPTTPTPTTPPPPIPTPSPTTPTPTPTPTLTPTPTPTVTTPTPTPTTPLPTITVNVTIGPSPTITIPNPSTTSIPQEEYRNGSGYLSNESGFSRTLQGLGYCGDTGGACDANDFIRAARDWSLVLWFFSLIALSFKTYRVRNNNKRRE